MGFDRHILLCNYIPTKFWNISINPVYLTAPPSIQLLPEGDNCSDPYQYSLVLPILEFHLNKITDYALSLFSLFNMFERSPFTLLHVSEVSSFCCCCRVVVYFITIPKSVYPVVCWQTFGFSQVWDYYE